MVDPLAAQEPADDPDRLLEHLQPDVRRRPALADDVLVQRLAGAHAEDAGHPAACAAAVAAAWATTAGWVRTVGQVTAVVTGSEVTWLQGADHRPDERALALLVVPRVEVVGDPQALETGALGQLCLSQQLLGWVFLAGQEVSEPHPVRLASARTQLSAQLASSRRSTSSAPGAGSNSKPRCRARTRAVRVAGRSLPCQV